MTWEEATTVGKQVKKEGLGVPEQLRMQSPPTDEESYVVLVRLESNEVRQVGPVKPSLADLRELLA